jgi:death-on-curing protein
MENIVFLTTKQVLEIHDEQIELYRGLPGVRDQNLLESAVAQPLASFFGEPLHKSIYEMATAYFISLAKNHAFNDGNKRTASLTVFTFLYMNGLLLQVDEDELVAYTLLIATETPQ